MKPSAGTFSSSAERILGYAYEQAARRGAQAVEPEHVLLGILEMKGNPARKLLESLHKDPAQMGQILEARIPPPQPEPATARATEEMSENALSLSEASRQIVNNATRESRHLGHAEVEAIHLLMGMLYESEGLVWEILAQNEHLTLYDLRMHLLQQPARRQSGFFAAGGSVRMRATGSWIRSALPFLVLVGVMLLSGGALYVAGDSSLTLPLILVFVVSGWITSVCIHEFGHALAAYIGGDQSVKEAGYLTLNPLKYTEPVFSILLPVLFLLLGGLGLPGGAVYIHPHALRSAGWRSLVAAAGPLGTSIFGLLLASPFLLGLVPRLTPDNIAFWSALAFLGFLQVTALCFNLIPIPPLDGFGILEPYLPAEVTDQVRQYSMLLFVLLLIILWADNPLSQAFWSETFKIAQSVGFPPHLVYHGLEQFLIWE